MTDPLLLALLWIQQSITGSLATLVAILVVAAFGFQMLAGRINQRQALSLVSGCFMIFGAAEIAAGVSVSRPQMDAPATNSLSASIVLKPAAATGFDPYAGVAMIAPPVSKDEYRQKAPSN